MRKAIVRSLSGILIFVLSFTNIIYGKHIVRAADSTVKIYIGDSKTARHHFTIAKGNTSDEFSFEVKDYDVVESSYRSSNTAVFQIESTGKGTCTIVANKEGTGLVTLTVKTKNGRTLTEKVFISVHTGIEQYQGVTAREAGVYRGASTRSGVENDDQKGTLAKDRKVTVIASCDDFYRIRTQDGTVFEDDRDTGFVKKTDVKILAGEVKLQQKNISIETGDSIQMNATVAPDITSDQSLKWNSGNSNILSVNTSGKVSAQSEGTTTISVLTSDGSDRSDSTYISVYETMTEVQGYLKSETALYAVGNDKVSTGTAKEKTVLTVVGTCESYYYVEIADSFYYVPKAKVAIPVTGITLNKKRVSVKPGGKEQLTATVIPACADNKKITWSSDNPYVAGVDSNGMVTALMKEGKATITAVAEDGKITAECNIAVYKDANTTWSDSQNSKPPAQKKTKFKVHAKGKTDSSIIITWNKQKKAKRYEIQRAAAGSKKYKTVAKVKKNKKQYIDNKVKFYKKYKYRLCLIHSNGKKQYSNVVSARTKDVNFDLGLAVQGDTTSSIKITWKKQKYVKKYIIKRSDKKNGKYKKIKEVNKNKNSFIDKNVQYRTDYYYVIEVEKTKGRDRKSKVLSGRTKFKVDLEKNKKYFETKYPSVCMDPSQDMNDYSVYNNYYAPIKYRFDGETLEMHIYLKFIRYLGNSVSGYTRHEVDTSKKKDGYSYTDLFKEGVKKYYDAEFVDNEHEFQGINFRVKVVLHEKEECNPAQVFLEVAIGGVCPDCDSDENEEDPYWYHIQYFDDVARIYMPYDYQLSNNTDSSKKGVPARETYRYIAAHEISHFMGLMDGYSKNGIDRFNDNEETGVIYKCDPKNRYYGAYDNIMVELSYKQKILPNDVEMMLYSYMKNQGKPWRDREGYKKSIYSSCSSCIIDTRDLFVAKGER